jgi:predicted transcriptional regulator
MRDTSKQAAMKLIEAMPDDVSTEQIMYELYVREHVERGRSDLEHGRVVSHDEVRRNLATWLQSAGR